MSAKVHGNQSPARRKPLQARARFKVELMLEAAIQLIDELGLDALTTNAVAARAGVSIGTLYQYFHDKQALLDELMGRELAAMGEKVLDALQEASAPDVPGGRVRAVVRAVMQSYGGRNHVHRQLIAYSLSYTSGGRLAPLYTRLVAMLSGEGVEGPAQPAQTLTPAQAFVLTYAMSGVLRTLAARDDAPPTQEVEDALVLLITGFLAATRAHA